MTVSSIATQPEAAPRSYRVVDADVHHRIGDWSELSEFVPEGLRARLMRKGGPPLARSGFRPGGPTAPANASGATSPEAVRDDLGARGIDVAVLTGAHFELGVQPNPDIASALATGINSWTLERWVRPFSCFRASILIAPQDPNQAVAEIDRLGKEPSVVQVLLGSASEHPLGRRQYHPIYAACVRHNLPLALHTGGEGTGMSPPATAAGHPATTFGWYGALPQSYMAHLMSMVTEGVFERFPELRVVLYEGGIAWLPHVMWRFDKNWKAQRAETPWVKERPSAYILKHVYSTMYPVEKPEAGRTLHGIAAMVDAERRLLFSTSYPDDRYGDPFDMLEELPEAIRPNVLAGNAMALYGDRL
jgi:predicted TIM-barrel fold metal-dependent hydrolase